MKQVVVTDLFTTECSAKFGIRPSHAEQALAAPDKEETLTSDDGQLTLHLTAKLSTEADPPVWVLLITQDTKQATKVLYGLRVYPDIDTDLANKTPLQMLELVAERFGNTVQIGIEKRKFFRAAHIPNASGSPTIQTTSPASRSFALQQWMRVNSDGSADVMLAFSLDTDVYGAWLRAHKRTASRAS